MKRYFYLGKMRTIDEIAAIYETVEKSWEQHLQWHPKTVYPFRHSKVEALDKAALAKGERGNESHHRIQP